MLGPACHSHGVLLLPSGERYEGQWRQHAANGQGVHVWRDGRCVLHTAACKMRGAMQCIIERWEWHLEWCKLEAT